jgi:eukaryotic-like serine/threonine-protein kinase
VSTIDRIGKYAVLGTLGKGAHSSILHVRRQADSREYALKVVTIDDPEQMKFVEQARHEFKIAQMLGHPNLIKIYCLETQKDWLFRVKGVHLLIEFVNGKTLDQVPPMSMEKLVPVLAWIASGLMHMHRRGVFHADLKPNNIMLGKRGEVKILDYGLAHIKGETKNRIQGTPEYIAPETVRSKIINERTDIYNLGATMYRLTTLQLPPSMASSPEVRLSGKFLKSKLKPVNELNHSVPDALCKLIHRCLDFVPEKRPERMGEVYEDLKQIAEDLGEPLEGGTDLGE